MVESVGGKVCPHGVVFLAVHDAFLQAFKHLLLTLEICLAFIVDFVEVYAQTLVGLVKSGIHP